MKRTALKKRRTKLRRGPLRDAGYRRWLRTKPCAVAGEMTFWIGPLSDAAHTENNGMSSKGPDSSCVPLCRKHHRLFDADRRGFQEQYGLNLKVIAAELYARYISERDNG